MDLVFEVRNGFEGDFRLSKQMFGDGRESRMQFRKGHKGPMDANLPTFILDPEGKCLKQQFRRQDHSDDADRQFLASL
jgi:hypothetical protein